MSSWRSWALLSQPRFFPYVHQSRRWLVMITGYAILFYLLVSVVDRWERVYTLTMMAKS